MGTRVTPIYRMPDPLDEAEATLRRMRELAAHLERLNRRARLHLVIASVFLVVALAALLAAVLLWRR
jgi:hypothetical protein